MRPRTDMPGVVTTHEEERTMLYLVAAYATSDIALLRHNQAINGAVEAAILDDEIQILPRTLPGEPLELNVAQTRFVLSGIHSLASKFSRRAEDSETRKEYEQAAEQIEAFLNESIEQSPGSQAEPSE